MGNKLYYGDNLAVLREQIKDESVDLVYLDPPFNSNATYNVLFRAPTGEHSQAQIEAFGDTWHWNEQAEHAYWQVLRSPSVDAAKMLQAMRGFLGENDMMAYLTMMAVRLIELHRVLKPTGSLYLHCDPTASHYLKMLLDGIFGKERFQNEIIWLRTHSHNFKTSSYVRQNDTIFYYTKSERFTFNQLYLSYGEAQLARFKKDEDGRPYKAENLTFSTSNASRQFEWRGTKPPANRSWGASREQLETWLSEGRILLKKNGSPRLDGLKVYLDETKGKPLGTNWTDIPRVGNTSGERLGYPTQKPVALLERILSASSNEGDVVLDPFCGCGTTIHAAQKLNRQWIGIDITHLAISLVGRRLRESFGEQAVFETIGVPKDLEGAKALAEKNKFEFERWAVTLIPDAQPYKSKGGGDKGVDGILYFRTGQKGTGRKEGDKAILSVKGGKNIKPGDVRDLKGTVEREKAMFGLFLTLYEPTRQMLAEAASAGFVETEWGKFPKIQILTIESLMKGERARIPGIVDSSVYKKAAKEDASERNQGGFDL